MNRCFKRLEVEEEEAQRREKREHHEKATKATNETSCSQFSFDRKRVIKEDWYVIEILSLAYNARFLSRFILPRPLVLTAAYFLSLYMAEIGASIVILGKASCSNKPKFISYV